PGRLLNGSRIIAPISSMLAMWSASGIVAVLFLVQKVETGKSGECRAGYREPDRLLGHGKFRSVGWQQAVRLPRDKLCGRASLYRHSSKGDGLPGQARQ